MKFILLETGFVFGRAADRSEMLAKLHQPLSPVPGDAVATPVSHPHLNPRQPQESQDRYRTFASHKYEY